MPAIATQGVLADVPPPINPPMQLTRGNYRDWLGAIKSDISAFFDPAFDWYETQLRTPMPAQVGSDPEKVYVAVDAADQQTTKLENSADIDQGNTMGFDAYFRANVPISVGLKTMLFFCGKPVGLPQGDTYPYNDTFATCHLSIRENWGANNYLTTVSMMNGGFAQNLYDYDTVLLRGNGTDGYVLFASFYGPVQPDKTATISEISISMLKSSSENVIECRQCVRRNGQSYKFLPFGRQQFGFNVARFRKEEIAVRDSMIELKTTGKIKENRSR